LEQHDRAGGSLHSFEEKGFEWDSGVHYIGRMGKPYDMTRVILDSATDGQVEWATVGAVYDEVRIGNDVRVSIGRGREAFLDSFEKAIPGCRPLVERYLKECERVRGSTVEFLLDREIAGATNVFSRLKARAMKAVVVALSGSSFPRANRTVDEVFKEIGITDPVLRGALTYAWGDIGDVPSKSSFYVQALLTLHYMEGAYYPKRGTMEIPRYAIPVVERAGGKVLVRAPIETILVEDSSSGPKVTGVRLEDGTVLEAPVVISTAGVRNTWSKLVPAEAVKAVGYGDLAESLAPSVGSTHVSLFIGLKGSSRENALPSSNMWIFADPDHDKNVGQCLENPLTNLSMFFCSFPSAKDPEYDARHGGKTSTAEVLSLAPYSLFEPFKGERIKHRGAEYERMKEQMAKQMFATLYHHFPHLKDKVQYFEVSTPITTEYYLGSAGGASYGVEHTPRRFAETRLRATTPIRGLFMSGQDILTVGVSSSIVAGAITAGAVLNRNIMFEVMNAMAKRRKAGRRKGLLARTLGTLASANAQILALTALTAAAELSGRLGVTVPLFVRHFKIDRLGLVSIARVLGLLAAKLH
jgi:all-trans-retinol 13,14-reductase